MSTPPFTPSPVTPTPTFDDPATDTDETTTEQTDEDTNTDETTATLLAGTVVHLNPKAGSYSIASDDGQLTAIHTGNAPDIGQRVEVEARLLANGTYSEDGNRKRKSKRGQAEFGGTVSFRDPETGIYTVSATGVSVLVRGGAQRVPPELGESVQVKVRIADHPDELAVSPAGQEGCGAPPALPKPPPVALEQVGLEAADSETDETTETTETDGDHRDHGRDH